MRGVELTFDVHVRSVSALGLPPNCAWLMRAYVGDLTYGVFSEPHGRGVFLASPTGYFFLDLQQLVASFADAVRDYDHDRGFLEAARGATGDPAPEIIPQLGSDRRPLRPPPPFDGQPRSHRERRTGPPRPDATRRRRRRARRSRPAVRR